MRSFSTRTFAGRRDACRTRNAPAWGEPERSSPYHLSGARARSESRRRKQPGVAVSHPSTGLACFFFATSVKLPTPLQPRWLAYPAAGTDVYSHASPRHGLARFPRIGGPWTDDWVKQVKEANDIVDVVGGYLALRPAGAHLQRACALSTTITDHRSTSIRAGSVTAAGLVVNTATSSVLFKNTSMSIFAKRWNCSRAVPESRGKKVKLRHRVRTALLCLT